MHASVPFMLSALTAALLLMLRPRLQRPLRRHSAASGVQGVIWQPEDLTRKLLLDFSFCILDKT